MSSHYGSTNKSRQHSPNEWAMKRNRMDKQRPKYNEKIDNAKLYNIIM